MALLYFIYDILSKIFLGIINHSYKYFNSKNTADYIFSLTNGIKLVEENYITSLLLALQFSVAFLGTIGIFKSISNRYLFVNILLIFHSAKYFWKETRR